MKSFYCLIMLIFGSIGPIWSQTDGVLPVDDGQSSGECQNSTVEMCNGIGTSVYLPNFRNHETQTAASSELNDFNNLIASGCSEYVRQFFCSFYLPLCYVSLGTNEAARLRPCRALCIETREKCEPVLLQNSNFTWPEFLNCSLDTFVSDGNLCFGRQVTVSTQPTTTTTTTPVVEVSNGISILPPSKSTVDSL